MTDYLLSRDAFLADLVRNPHTIRNYRRAINLFAGDHAADEPRFDNTPLPNLSHADISILTRFTQWLLDERALAPATVLLYASAVKQWFEWMGVNDYLPADFPLTKALWSLDRALSAKMFQATARAPVPPEGIEQVTAYYESRAYGERVLTLCQEHDGDQEYARRLALEMLRNRALLHCLTETGGRISEVLSLRVSDFPPRAFVGDVWRVSVTGKGGARYSLRFLEALPHVRAYTNARGEDGQPTLFITHSKRYDRRALSRQAAWKIVTDAAAALGLGRIHPHDFRHLCASRLVEAGEPLDVVQEYLGHRSVETTRRYYAHTKEARVDEATKRLRGTK